MTVNLPKLWNADTMSSTLPLNWLHQGLMVPSQTPNPPCVVVFKPYASTE
jgi:hypothetical protein